MTELRAALAAALLSSCIAPSVVASSGRAVVAKVDELAWRPARAEDLLGLFESTAIEGEAAAALWRVSYYFAADGTFSGAALVLGDAGPGFQTLSGTWTLADGELDLGEGSLARASAAPEFLRLVSDGGAVTLHRVAVE
jgi:hypothetical protein